MSNRKPTALVQLIALAAIAAITIPPAVIHGKLSNRWQSNTALEFHSKAIEQVPTKVAEWRVIDESNFLTEPVKKELGIHGYFHRIYENDTGEQVNALVMVGEAGPLIRHPVEVCYGNRAKMLVNSYDVDFEQGTAEHRFNVFRYQPKSALEDEFYVAYAFCYDDQWDTPNLPRIKYGGKPLIYKMQVLTNAGSVPPYEVPEHLKDFVKQFSAVVWRKQ